MTASRLFGYTVRDVDGDSIEIASFDDGPGVLLTAHDLISDGYVEVILTPKDVQRLCMTLQTASAVSQLFGRSE